MINLQTYKIQTTHTSTGEEKTFIIRVANKFMFNDKLTDIAWQGYNAYKIELVKENN